MSTSFNPLQYATFMLAQREAFQNWTQGSLAQWHKKWLGSPRAKPVMISLFGLAGLGAMGMMAHGVTGGPMAPVWFGLGVFSFSLSFIALIGVMLVDTTAASCFNPILNRHSKKYGVWFEANTPEELWGPCPQNEKTQLLSNLAKLDDRWDSIKSGVLSLITTSDLPYVWWFQLQHTIDCELRHHQHNRNQSEQHSKFIQAQTEVQAQVQRVEVEVETERHALETNNILLFRKTKNILL